LEITNANATHYQYAAAIADCIDSSAKIRGTGIALRTPEYIRTKMQNGNAVIAIQDNTFVGFCYIEVWGHGKYIAHSGSVWQNEKNDRNWSLYSQPRCTAYAFG